MKIMLIDFFDVVDSAGGMERVLCNMANEFIARGYTVSVVCCDKKEGLPFYHLNKDVEFINLNGTGKLFNIKFMLKLQKEIIRLFGNLDRENKEKFRLKFLYSSIFDKLKYIIEKLNPNIIISYDKDSLMVLKNFLNIECPVIAMMHQDVNIFINKKTSKFLLAAYRKTNYIQVLIKDNIEIINKYCLNANVCWIPNVVYITEQKDDVEYYNKIITVGRLEKKAKQQHLLIYAFQKLYKKYPKWKLEIIGGTNSIKEVEYMREIKTFVKKNFPINRVLFSGKIKNVNEKLLKADIFAFPSAYEGMPLALTEAMAAGLPAIGYKSCPAVNELIIDGYNGFLCEDGIDDFAEKLKILMQDAVLRKKMGQNARESMKQFAPEKIWDEWEDLINKVVEESKK